MSMYISREIDIEIKRERERARGRERDITRHIEIERQRYGEQHIKSERASYIDTYTYIEGYRKRGC